MLTEHGALSILIDNGPDKKPNAISFRIQTDDGLLGFRLPARLGQIAKILATSIPAPITNDLVENRCML
jgi:hypothetical protein